MIAMDGSTARARVAHASRALTAAITIFGTVATAIWASTAGLALPRYDGLWSVSIVTEKGDCDRGYRYPVRITRGVLSNAGDVAFSIAGNVGPTGLIRVTVSYGAASANGVGKLSGNIGNGSWIGGSCSGTWTAERRG